MYIEHSSLRDFLNFASTSLLYNAFHDFVPDFDEDSRIAYLDYMTAVEWFDEQGFPNIFVDTYNVSSKGLFGANIHEISALSFIPEIAYDYEIFALGFPYSYEGFKKTHLRLSLLRKFLKSRYSLFKKSFENRNYMDPNSEKDKDSYESKNHTGAYSFEKGLTELTNAIGEHLGDKIQLNSTAIQVSRYEEDNYIVVYRDKEGNNHTMTCKVVILAVPAPIALWIAPSLLNDEQKEIIEQIEFSSYITVALFSGQPIFNKAFDLAVPNDFFFTDIYDATWIQRYYNDSLKDSPHHIITVYVPPKSYKNRSVLSLSDHEILNKIYQDLESIFPGASQKVTGYDITRFPYAYPVMTFGAYHRLSRLREITSGSFLLAGDSTIYPTFESALYSGYLAAKKAEDYIIRPGGC
jgi:protoporphyrinogen oxidase